MALWRREDDYSTFKAREGDMAFIDCEIEGRKENHPLQSPDAMCDGETFFMTPNLTLRHILKKEELFF